MMLATPCHKPTFGGVHHKDSSLRSELGTIRNPYGLIPLFGQPSRVGPCSHWPMVPSGVWTSGYSEGELEPSESLHICTTLFQILPESSVVLWNHVKTFQTTFEMSTLLSLCRTHIRNAKSVWPYVFLYMCTCTKLIPRQESLLVLEMPHWFAHITWRLSFVNLLYCLLPFQISLRYFT
jgi:hypothetical protein